MRIMPFDLTAGAGCLADSNVPVAHQSSTTGRLPHGCGAEEHVWVPRVPGVGTFGELC